jgi:hypothetical protein
MADTTAPGFPASEPLGNQGLQQPKRRLADKLTFEQINEVTVKVTDGSGTNAWTGGRSGSNYRTTKALAWLMAVGNGQWVVRYRNKASRPMKLPKAKKFAVEMIKGIRPGRIVIDPISELNRMQCIVESYSSAAAKQEAA